MRSLKHIVCFAVLCTMSGCFIPEQDCRVRCGAADQCPDDLVCVIDHAGQHLCAARGDATCGIALADDGGADGAPGTLGAIQTPAAQICLTRGCFQLSPPVRAGMVLLLDPSTLPAALQGVTGWMDRSGHANHAQLVNSSVIPVSNGRGVTLGTRLSAGFVVPDAPSLSLGTGDFVVLVEATSTSSNIISEFFFKSNVARPAAVHQIEIAWLYPSTDDRPTVEAGINEAMMFPPPGRPVPPERLITLRRSGTRLSLRLDGVEVGTSEVAPGDSVDNDSDLFLGIPSSVGYSVDGLGLVMVVRGPVADGDLTALEGFLVASFGLAP